MGVRFKRERIHTIPLTIVWPKEDSSKRKEIDRFTVTYAVAKASMFTGLDAGDADVAKQLIDELAEHIRDWDIQDEDGGKLEVTPDNIAMVLDDSIYRRIILEGWLAASTGQAVKN